MSDLGYVFREMELRRVGLAPHYLFLYGVVLGLESQCVFEFGTGTSTRVILDALLVTGGQLWSVSTEAGARLPDGSLLTHHPRWAGHLQVALTSEPSARHTLPPAGPFDLVLHDGSHSADVVEADLRWALCHLRQYGLLLVHDTQHSYVGEEMRRAVGNVLRDFDVSSTTLPYGFGLTIIRNEAPSAPPAALTWRKFSSPHETVSRRVE